MINLFQAIDDYIMHQGTTYGDIKSPNKENNLNNILSREEKKIYDDTLQSDKARLLRFQ